MANSYVGLRLERRKPSLRQLKPAEAKRCAARLLKMRESLRPLRHRKSDNALLLATWNIRDFDSNKFGYGPRLPETFYYIAEMISCFDLVAVQEVSRDLRALHKVMSILGREWDYIATDTTEGAGGNNERMAFVYNTEKVWFRKVAGEIVLPEGQLIVSIKKKKKAAAPKATAVANVSAAVKSGFEEAKQQFARTPFLVAFQSGWFKFSLCTVHIYYGAASGEALKRRIEEIRKLVGFFAARQDTESQMEFDELGAVENYVLLGDFNVVSPEHETMAALKSKGFEVPEPIDGDKVRLKDKKKHYYDQIAVRVKDPRFSVTGGGLVEMFQDVFREEDIDIYRAEMPAEDPESKKTMKAKTPEALFKKWRTWQMSDHDPLWIEVQTDFADDYLKQFAK